MLRRFTRGISTSLFRQTVLNGNAKKIEQMLNISTNLPELKLEAQKIHDENEDIIQEKNMKSKNYICKQERSSIRTCLSSVVTFSSVVSIPETTPYLCCLVLACSAHNIYLICTISSLRHQISALDDINTIIKKLKLVEKN